MVLTKNDYLCYMDKSDWSIITHSDHIILPSMYYTRSPSIGTEAHEELTTTGNCVHKAKGFESLCATPIPSINPDLETNPVPGIGFPSTF